MIGKIKKGNYFYGALKYNVDKIKLDKANRICAVGFEKTEPTNREILYEFLRLAKAHHISEPVAHISLNFAIGEELDDDTLKKITHDYMTFMGYGKTPYVIFRHNDAAHAHVHIVTANITVGKNGKYRKVEDSNNYYNNKEICALIEKRYGLVVAQGRGKKTTESESIKPKFHTYGTVPSFEQLKEVVDYVLKNNLFINKYELNKLLNDYSIAVFGSMYHGVKYYKFTFVDKNGKGIGVGGTPKQLKLEFTKRQIDQLFSENQKKLKEYLANVRLTVKKWLKEYYSIAYSDLQQKLQGLNIGVEESGQCRDLQNNRQFTLKQLGVPDGLIKKATVKREYFKAFSRLVTTFRREYNIWYETTLLRNDALLKELREFAKKHLEGLSQAQIHVLYDGFCEYKLQKLPELEISEHLKDIKWTNKVIAYVNLLSLPYSDRVFLLKEFGIEIGDKEILIRNDMDEIVHYLKNQEILPIVGNKGEKSIYAKQITLLTTLEKDIIRGCISGRYFYQPNADFERLALFLPTAYFNQLDKLKNDYTLSNIKHNIRTTLLPNQYDLKTGKLLRWRDSSNDEEDERSRRRGRRRKM